jgi:hypothetical protein
LVIEWNVPIGSIADLLRLFRYAVPWLVRLLSYQTKDDQFAQKSQAYYLAPEKQTGQGANEDDPAFGNRMSHNP